ncbi:MAG: hypothetical protein ABI837_13280 [Acidobacteriota bacterium]
MTTAHRPHWLLPVAFVLVAIASLAPIRSNDYFWHLATGRWMVEHRALPLSDPFAVASSREPWINDEWLFELALYPLYALGGHAAVSLTLAVATAGLFAWLLRLAANEAGALVALPLIVVSWYGAEAWLCERPSTAGAICLVALLSVLLRSEGSARVAGTFAITVLWINIHPSALIAPAVVALYEGGQALDRKRFGPLLRPWSATASTAALFFNPYGLEGLIAPIRLTGLIAQFHNQEWAPSRPGEFPLFYACAIGGLLLFALGGRREWSRALVFAFLTVLAFRFCRNQGLFFAAAPLLLSAAIPNGVSVRIRQLAAFASVAAFLAVLTNAYLAVGIDEGKFPVTAVARLRATGLRGNIYNSYGTGGYLIWSFYPERRVVTDGRNELFVHYNAEHERALRDPVAWRALIRKYDLRLAVFDYHQPPVAVFDPRNGKAVRVPQAVAYFPPRQWALIGVDEVAMLFARRDAFRPEELAKLEVH